LGEGYQPVENVEELAIKDEAKDILSFRVTFASGHRVTALTTINLRGKRGKVVIDEFASENPGN